jgi:hypothetical protein
MWRLLVVVCFLIGCASAQTMHDAINSWVGASVDDAVRYWGIPPRTFEMHDGSTMYEWVSIATLTIPGSATSTSTTIGGVTQTNTTSIPPGIVGLSCTRMLIARKDGIVTEARWAGDCCGTELAEDCRSLWANPNAPRPPQ